MKHIKEVEILCYVKFIQSGYVLVSHKLKGSDK